MNAEQGRRWLEALRSGDYQQGSGNLLNYNDGKSRYCCLGVACSVEMERLSLDVQIDGYEFPCNIDNRDLESLKLDPLLVNEEEFYELVAAFNDGDRYRVEDYSALKDHPDVVKDDDTGYYYMNHDMTKYSFEWIADWIEKNVEFVENETTDK